MRRVLFACLLVALAAVPALAADPAPYTDPVLGIRFLPLEGGCFEMGDTFLDGEADEKPAHEICLSDVFMAAKEVSVRQFQQFVAETGYVTEAEHKGYCYVRTEVGKMARAEGARWSMPGFVQTLDHPVVCVTAADATAFAAWLTQKTGRAMRLPTEAEWEFACRAGGRQIEYGTYTGDMSHEQANLRDTGGRDKWGFTAPTGSFPPNPAGFNDMSGNVAEWVADAYAADAYARHTPRDPLHPGTGDHVKRGGSFAMPMAGQRCANRGSNPMASDDIGFRLVLEPK
ncbi:MAG: formylglycine-generating enzyme family protein [Desulfovibrionaceae bacterium]